MFASLEPTAQKLLTWNSSWGQPAGKAATTTGLLCPFLSSPEENGIAPRDTPYTHRETAEL